MNFSLCYTQKLCTKVFHLVQFFFSFVLCMKDFKHNPKISSLSNPSSTNPDSIFNQIYLCSIMYSSLVDISDQVVCSFMLFTFPFRICFDFSKLVVILIISPLLFLLSISSGSNINSKLLFCIFSL